MLASVVDEETVASAAATTTKRELAGEADTSAIENDMERSISTSTSTIQGSNRRFNHSNSQDGAGGRRQRADPPAARLYEDYEADSVGMGPPPLAAVTIEPSHDLALTTAVVAVVSDLKYSNHCNHTVTTATTDATRPTYKDQVQPVPLSDRQQRQACLSLVPVARAVYAAELQPERNSNIVEDGNNTMGHEPAIWAQLATTEQPVANVVDDAANHNHYTSAQSTAHSHPPVDAFPAKNRQDEALYYAAILQTNDELNGIRPQPPPVPTDSSLQQNQHQQVPMLPRHLLYIVRDVPAIRDNIHLVKAATEKLRDCTGQYHDMAERDNTSTAERVELLMEVTRKRVARTQCQLDRLESETKLLYNQRHVKTAHIRTCEHIWKTLSQRLAMELDAFYHAEIAFALEQSSW